MTSDSTNIAVTTAHATTAASIPSCSLGMGMGMGMGMDGASDDDDGQPVDVLRLGCEEVDSHTNAISLHHTSWHDGNHLHVHDTTATTNTLNDKVVVQVGEARGDEDGTEGLNRSNRKSLLVSCSSCPGKATRASQLARQLSDYKEPHLGRGRQYWRDIMLGVNDGLVSTFLLVAGVVGANLSNTDILLTALSGAIAGAISMAAGEYVATKTQRQVMDGEIILERKHIANNRDSELGELNETFTIIGIDEHDSSDETNALRTQLLNYYRKRDGAHLKVHAVLEHGVVEKEKRSPWVAGTISFFVFIAGTLPSVIPFCVTGNVNSAFTAAAVCATMGLLLVGAIKTWATRGNLLVASAENLFIAAAGGAISYGVGVGFEKLVNS